MSSSTVPPNGSLSVEGIEVEELSDIDLEFVQEAFRHGQRSTPESTITEPARPEELKRLEMFQALDDAELAAMARKCESIHAAPGYVLHPPGKNSTKVYFVLEGQLRLYSPTREKRPIAIVDVGQSTGLRQALLGHPANHSMIATEISKVLAIELAVLEDGARRSHAFARHYAALLAGYVRSDNCLHVGLRASADGNRPGLIDELTLLHNQHWLDTVLPRLVARSQLAGKPLAVVAFAIDKLEQISQRNGVAASARVLAQLGHWLLDQTRPTDLLAINRDQRILAFLPDSDLDGARQLAERLKEAVQALAVSPAPDQPPAPKCVTLSLGVAELEEGMKEQALLARAQALIERSLKQGGNCVSTAP